MTDTEVERIAEMAGRAVPSPATEGPTLLADCYGLAVDITHLRALNERYVKLGRPSQRHHAGSAAALQEWMHAIDDAAPALFDELESARAEVERLKQHRGCPCQRCQDNGAYKERAAIVAWLRSPRLQHHLADCIERGDHLARKEPQP